MMQNFMLLLDGTLLVAPAVAEKYNNQNITITLPSGGWKVVNESTNNITLSDEVNSIEIDIIEVPDNLTEAVRNYENWSQHSIDSVFEYYIKEIKDIEVQSSGTGGLVMFHPDGVEFPAIGFSSNEEWYVTWSKPEYINKMIGVRAIFPGNSTEVVPTGWHGTMIPKPLFTVLKDFKTNF